MVLAVFLILGTKNLYFGKAGENHVGNNTAESFGAVITLLRNSIIVVNGVWGFN